MSVTTVALGEVATLQAGIGFPPALQGRSDGDFPFAKVGDISRCGRSEFSVLSTADHYIDESDVAQLRAKPVPAGSVLFAKIGEAIRQNHRVIAGRPLLIDNNAMAAIPSERIDSHFLYHYLKTVDFYALAPATTVPALRKSELEGIRVPFFPLQEQRRIAAILDQAETLRTQRRTALALLDSLTQSLFLDMFGDPETNKIGFQISTLGSAIKLKSGNFLPASQMADKGQFPVYGGNGINGKHDEFMFEEPKIVIGRVGAYCGCVHVTEPRSWVTDNALYIEAFDSALHPEYLAFALSEAKLNQYASQSGQPLISGARIAAVKLLVPPLPLQQTFATRIASIEALKATHRRALAALDALFASLQQQAFAGQL